MIRDSECALELLNPPNSSIQAEGIKPPLTHHCVVLLVPIQTSDSPMEKNIFIKEIYMYKITQPFLVRASRLFESNI